MQVRKQQLDMEQQTGSKFWKEYILFNLYAEYIMRNAGLGEAQAGVKIAGKNINNLRYADDTTLMAESEEELKSLLMKVSTILYRFVNNFSWIHFKILILFFMWLFVYLWASLVAQTVSSLPIIQETRVWSLAREDPLEKEMATHFNILPWKIPWAKEPCGLQSMGLHRVGHNWVTNTFCLPKLGKYY